jgi:hypothetical protein
MSAARLTRRSISAFGRFPRPQAEGDVLVDRQIGIERVVLEHHGDVAILRAELVDHAPADRDHAGIRLLQAGDCAQQGALAAAGGADQHGELAGRDFEVDGRARRAWRRRTCAGRES